VLIVGAGPAGIAAAYAAGASGARVILVDDQPEPGGGLLSSAEVIDDKAPDEWIATILAELRGMPEVTILNRTSVFGYQDHNLLTACERRTDHLPLNERRGSRERLWKIRAKRAILTTGAHERPIVFGNNDLPGIMLASAVSTYIHRYAVCPGRRALIFTNNDNGYQAAVYFKECGGDVTVIDARVAVDGAMVSAARMLGIPVVSEAVVLEAKGTLHVNAAIVASYKAGTAGAAVGTYDCDLIAVSGGWNPALHLFAQSGGRARWDERKACFVPGPAVQAACSVGAANGDFSLAAALDAGARAGCEAAVATGFDAPQVAAWHTTSKSEEPILPLWLTGDRVRVVRSAKHFVDYQNDVVAADIYLAVREGYESIEHVKRYTTLGFGTDQGKLGNINGMAILADALGQTIAETGTTTFRPNYTPVTFGLYAGREIGEFFDPARKTCLHEWHVERGAVFEDAGAWKRPRYFPRSGEDLNAAVARECRAVRNAVGVLDASTLGKIDMQGPDSVALLNSIYTNTWNSLEIGKCRYGLMVDENGMVFDDGVTARLGENHFLMSTTTAGAARVLNWMERWLQTEWPHLRVYLTSVTDHFATFAVAGPDARDVLQKVCSDVDFSASAFPFMTWREGTVAGIGARIMRISFSGELSYEVNVPANVGRAVWEALIAAGAEYSITPYGTEAMHVLRAEKGYIIVGQDTDGSVTPHDLGMDALVATSKDFLGKRSLTLAHTRAHNRKQLVGLLAKDPSFVLPEGSQILNERSRQPVAAMIGHVTSSYMSPTLNRSIALALLQSGRARAGQEVVIALPNARPMSAIVTTPVFYDSEGATLRVE
jgi:sarcosine oxidase subunit alpha